VAHGKHGFPQAIAALAEMEPDLAIVVEADPKEMNVEGIRSTFRTAFPEHQVSTLGGGLVLVSRWPSGRSHPYQIGEKESECRVREIDVQTPHGTWTVFAIDFGSNPLYDRGPAYSELAKLIERRNDHPVIVAGDFNTPLDSTHYQHFRDLSLREAFLTAGSGYLPTWPLPLPVMSLDQLWMNEHLTPVRCDREWSIRSDHAAVVGRVR
jgi:endonuclease/exonuclease/phosphatase (EEP) superfamily protein YafD